METWDLTGLLHGTVVGLIVAGILALSQVLWEKFADGRTIVDAIFRGLITFAILVLLVNQFWPKLDTQTTIHEWLERAAYSVQKEPPRQAIKFQYTATDRQNMYLSIYQEAYSGAPVFIVAGLDFTDEKKMSLLSLKDQDDLATNIQLALLSLGAGYVLTVLLQTMRIEVPFMFDQTMTEREFIEKTHLVSRAITSVQQIIHQKLAHCCNDTAPSILNSPSSDTASPAASTQKKDAQPEPSRPPHPAQ